MPTYLFYDIETTGLNKAFDQVLQFAAIRTDLNLNELKRYELRIRLNRDTVPSPQALLTHQISIKDMQQGVSEYDGIKQIHQWMNEPGTISLGYNTLNFDDEFLRFSFYRNLLPPYTHQFANQCGRMDIYPMTVMYFLFKNHILNWPQIDRKTSLKLANLNEANQLAKGQAHDAIVDVEATVALAKRLFQEKDMWTYLQGYFNKQSEQQRLAQLNNKQALLIDSIFGANQAYQSPVYFLGTHQHYKNQTLWLSLDTPELTQATPETLRQTLWVNNKKMGEPGFILPMSERFLQHLTPERLQQSEQNRQWLEKSTLLEHIIEHYTSYTFPVYPDTDANARLYLNGFWSPEETYFCQSFHRADPKEKSRLAEKIQQPLLATLAIRLLGRHFPEALTPKQTEIFENYLQQIKPDNTDAALIDFKGGKRLTPKQALEEMKVLRTESLSTHHLSLFKDLETYLFSM